MMASRSCSNGSVGKSLPVSSLTTSLNRSTTSLRSSAVRSVSSLAPTCCFFCVEHVLELGRVDVEDDLAEHLDEAAVGVVAEALVAGAADDALKGLVVQAEVEDGVHHARHRELGARADGDEQRVARIAELLAGLLLDVLERLEDLIPEALREASPLAVVVLVAGLGRDREAGGTGSPALVISATPAPLPPSRSRIWALPSLKR